MDAGDLRRSAVCAVTVRQARLQLNAERVCIMCICVAYSAAILERDMHEP